MPAPEEFTGERFLPDCTGEIWAEHWHRYVFATQYVDGLDVLDIASGEGYGSSLLGRRAKSVTGVDIDPPTVESAQSRYGNARVRFREGSVAAIPFPDRSFDCVVSFETLEHVTLHEEMLSELKRVLRPSGFIIISTPNRIEYSDKRGFRNEFHVRELDGPEFRALIGRYFNAQRWYGQRLLFNSGLWPLDRAVDANASSNISAEWVSVDERDRALPDPMYFVAIAAAKADLLPAPSSVATLLGDPDDSIYREYESTVARTLSLEQHLADRERIVVERDAQIALIDAQKRESETLIAARESLIGERDAQVRFLDQQKRDAERLVADRERVVIERDQQLDSVNARLIDAEALIASRERIVIERDAQVAAIDEQKRRAESLVGIRDAQLEQVNVRLIDAERLIADRERIVVERDAQIAAIDASKREAEALIAARERIIVERDAQIAALDSTKRGAEALIAERDRQLDALNDRIVELESLVAERERIIVERERIIVERDRQLTATNDRMSFAEGVIVERDRQLSTTNDRMSLAERVIAEREATIAGLQRDLEQAARRAEEMQLHARSLDNANAQLRREVARRAGWRWWVALPLRRMRGSAGAPGESSGPDGRDA